MAAEIEGADPQNEDRKSKKKKKKHNRKIESEDGDITDGEEPKKEKSSREKKEKEKKKKRKASDEERSDTSSDTAEPVGHQAVANGSALKRPRLVEKNGERQHEGVGGGDGNPNAVSKFRISKALREKLKSRGIESLFPIQAKTFDAILDGSDLVGRARTGQGKTLAFVLPILESLVDGQNKTSRKTGYGRPPCVLVLLPTRELANQVYSEFEVYGEAVGLSACCVYGGAPYHPQETALKRGVDVVVGTPGRIKDHIERGMLDLKSLKFRVLDEADEMLNMGFVEDVELILGIGLFFDSL